MVQAALTGQGVVLARLPMVAESLANGDLIEPLPKLRIDSPLSYWLIMGDAQHASARRSRLLRLAAGPGQGHAPDHRRSARPGHGGQHRLSARSADYCGPTIASASST